MAHDKNNPHGLQADEFARIITFQRDADTDTRSVEDIVSVPVCKNQRRAFLTRMGDIFERMEGGWVHEFEVLGRIG